MTPADITAIIGVGVTLVGLIVVPIYLARQRRNMAEADTEDLTATSVARMFKEERDALQVKLEKMQADYEQQIAQLKGEIDGLYRRLYQERPPS